VPRFCLRSIATAILCESPCQIVVSVDDRTEKTPPCQVFASVSQESATHPYRWNVAEHAAGYDAAAEHIHPHYVEIQEAVLGQITRRSDEEFLWVDIGGGSGRLAEKFLSRYCRARAVVVDQSEAFLDIAARRMAPFGSRGTCLVARLQDEWASRLPESPAVIVSMSAIHHLDPGEKRRVYQQCYEALAPGGLLLNGDEIRDPDDAKYLEAMQTWVAHMRRIVAEGRVNETMHAMLLKWEQRNTVDIHKPRASGDDYHETLQAQLGYLKDCGFRSVTVPWQKQMWAVMRGLK
jgi:tRNA (cmo5U34)-methyltransferase